MLKLNIKTTNIKIDDSLRNYIYEKIGTLDKFIGGHDEGVEAWVEIGKPSEHHQTGNVFRVEVNLNLLGRMLRSEAEEMDFRTAIDRVKEELQEEIKKYRGKKEAQYKRGARFAKQFLRLSPLAWFRKKKREREEGV